MKLETSTKLAPPILFMPLFLLLIMSVAAQAQDYGYAITNGAITITNYTGSGGVVNIPSTIGDLPVTSIGDSAFTRCTNLIRVTIGNNVTNIGSYSFSDCTSLNRVTIPSSVTTIGDWAFSGCTNLTGAYFMGNAPNAGSFIYGYYSPHFYSLDPVFNYYLPGTTGWADTFGHRVTVLWNPQPLMSVNIGVQTNMFGFYFTGNIGTVIVVDACTNLANPTWFPVATNIPIGGSSYFSDPQYTNHPACFYRLRMP